MIDFSLKVETTDNLWHQFYNSRPNKNLLQIFLSLSNSLFSNFAITVSLLKASLIPVFNTRV